MWQECTCWYSHVMFCVLCFEALLQQQHPELPVRTLYLILLQGVSAYSAFRFSHCQILPDVTSIHAKLVLRYVRTCQTKIQEHAPK